MADNHFQTSQQLTFDLFAEKSTFSAEVFPAKMQAKPSRTEKDSADLTESEQDSGDIWLERFMKSDLDTLLRKTLQTFSASTKAGTLQLSSTLFPDWGIMQNGELATVRRSVCVMSAKESGLLHSVLTPVAHDYNKVNINHSLGMLTRRAGVRACGNLPEQLFRIGVRGEVNYKFPLQIMGFPEDYFEEVL